MQDFFLQTITAQLNMCDCVCASVSVEQAFTSSQQQQKPAAHTVKTHMSACFRLYYFP